MQNQLGILKFRLYLHNYIDPNTPKFRVIGGREASGGEVPYQVAIMVENYGNLCGGSIYSSDTVITAAHCFYMNGQATSKDIFVLVGGKRDLRVTETDEQLSTVASVTVHPAYNSTTGVNDLALVKLTTPYCFNTHLQPIPLIGPGITPTGNA